MSQLFIYFMIWKDYASILLLGKVVSIISWKNVFLSKDEDKNETIKTFLNVGSFV